MIYFQSMQKIRGIPRQLWVFQLLHRCPSSHTLQVITVVTFDTVHMFIVAMSGELCLILTKSPCLTVGRPQVYHYVITNYQCVASNPSRSYYR